nr:retrovirus-related Pol polyprotein from transposon TNT 1-94 [Tanacetum cinerariifolium]
MVYFSAVSRDGIFEIDLSNPNAIDSSMYAVSNKRAKLNLDSALLWHVVLDTLARNALRSYNMMDFLIQMTLGLLKNSSLACVERWHENLTHIKWKEPKSTWTNTHRLFQKEIENQPGKTIKSLRFDRGGEYTSQEFLDHLKDYGIITHHTPPYTPQHNGYPKEIIGYSFYYPLENKVLVARNVEFLENSLIAQEASESLEELEIIQEEEMHPSIDTGLNHEEDDLKIKEP